MFTIRTVFKQFLVIAVLLSGQPIQAIAQESIPPQLEDKIDFDPNKELPKPDNIEPLSIPVGLEQEILDGLTIINVKSITYSGNNLIDGEKIDAEIAPFLNQTLSSSELSQIKQAIAQLYEKAGYVGSGAFISQKSRFEGNDSYLHLQIVELKISDVKVAEAGRLTKYVRQQFKRFIGKPLYEPELLNQIRFLLDDNRIDNLKINLLQKKRIDQRDLVIQIEPAKSTEVTLLVNNYRSPAVGTTERGTRVQNLNLLGFGDKISIDYRNTDGSNIVGLAYDIPANGRGGRLFARYLYSDSIIVEDPFDPFDIRTKTQEFAIGYEQPVLRHSSNSKIQELILGAEASRIENEDSLLSIPFPLSPGANDNGETRSTSINLTQQYSHRTPNSTLKLYSKIGIGTGLGAVNNSAFGDGSSISLTAQGLYARKLSDRWLYLTTANLQVANRNLVGHKQFGIGGRRTVRGVRTNLFASTNVVSSSQELQFIAYKDRKDNNRLSLSAFFDFAHAWNRRSQFDDPNQSVASVGGGLTFTHKENIVATFEYGIPFLGPDDTNQTLQEQGLTFSIEFRRKF